LYSLTGTNFIKMLPDLIYLVTWWQYHSFWVILLMDKITVRKRKSLTTNYRFFNGLRKQKSINDGIEACRRQDPSLNYLIHWYPEKFATRQQQIKVSISFPGKGNTKLW
jgi:hypothetical protein